MTEPAGGAEPSPAASVAIAPVLSADGARIAIDGAVAVDRFTLVSRGDRVILAGDPGALLAAITGVPRSATGAAKASSDDGDEELPGEAFVVAGALLVGGKSVADGAHFAVIGAAPLDPPLPDAWSVLEHVTWGARLAGASRWTAPSLADTALGRVGLREVRKKAIRALALHERRALALAQAVVSQPDVLIAEAPLSGLDGPAAVFVHRAIAGATEGRRAILSVSRLDPASPEGALARDASHLVVMSGGEIALEGSPGELFSGAKVYALTVHTNADALRDELAARGIELRGGPVRFSAALPAGETTRALLLASRAAAAPLVELSPVIG